MVPFILLTMVPFSVDDWNSTFRFAWSKKVEYLVERRIVMREVKKTSWEAVLYLQNVSPIAVGIISYKNKTD